MFVLYRILKDLNGLIIACKELTVNSVSEYNNFLNLSGKTTEEHLGEICEVLYTILPLEE